MATLAQHKILVYLFYSLVLLGPVLSQEVGDYDPDPTERVGPRRQLLVHIRDLLQDLQHVASHLESKLEGLENFPLGSQMAAYTVSVTGEGGCCGVTQEHPGPWFAVNNKTIPFTKSRGFNIVALDRKTGNVVRKGRFDTYNPDKTHTERMVDFINNGIPNDSVVLVGSYDSSETHCRAGSKCQEALQLLGNKGTIVGHRDSYALIGYKGAYCGASAKPSWVIEAHATYPGQTGREGKQTLPVTVEATIEDVMCY